MTSGPGTFRTLGYALRHRGDAPAILTGIARDHGDAVHVRAGPVAFYLLSNPAHVVDVLHASEDGFERTSNERRVNRRLLDDALFASEGTTRRRQRDLMEPVMFEALPAAQARTVTRHAARMADAWRDGARIDAMAHAEWMTRGMLVEALFGLDPAQPEGRRVAEALLAVNMATDTSPLGATALGDRLLEPRRKRFRELLAETSALIDGLARRRVEEGLTGEDGLTMLLRAGERAMTVEQARNETIGIYRGHLVTGGTLAWAWYLLSQHPEARDRVEREAAELGRDPEGIDDLHRLPFTVAVFLETIRLYPAAWVLGRRPVTDRVVAGTAVPAGSTVVVCPWVVQRDPRWWDEPDTFRPERFAEPLAGADHQGDAYLALGLGSKRCMGSHLLPVEAAFTLATVARRWRLELKPGHRPEIEAKATLKPRGGMPMTVRAATG
jgi:cytochrome P450